MSTYIDNIKFFAGVGLGSLLVFSCAKPREAKLASGPESQVFSLSELAANDLGKSGSTIKLGGTRTPSLFADPGIALNEMPAHEVATHESSLPDHMKYMFEALAVTGQPGQIFPIVFTVDDTYLTAYKVVDKATELSALECDLGFKKGHLDILMGLQFGKPQANAIQMFRDLGNACEKNSENLIYVPLFKYKIAAKGVLERKKNSLGEETADLVITPTDLKAATHIQIASGTDARQSAPFLDIANDEEISRIYLTEKVVVSNNVSLAESTSSAKPAPPASAIQGRICNGTLEVNYSGKLIAVPFKFVSIVNSISKSGKLGEMAKVMPTGAAPSRLMSLNFLEKKEIATSPCPIGTAGPELVPVLPESEKKSESTTQVLPDSSKSVTAQAPTTPVTLTPDQTKSVEKTDISKSSESPTKGDESKKESPKSDELADPGKSPIEGKPQQQNSPPSSENADKLLQSKR